MVEPDLESNSESVQHVTPSTAVRGLEAEDDISSLTQDDVFFHIDSLELAIKQHDDGIAEWFK